VGTKAEFQLDAKHNKFCSKPRKAKLNIFKTEQAVVKPVKTAIDVIAVLLCNCVLTVISVGIVCIC
jgi:hypothetical protein